MRKPIRESIAAKKISAYIITDAQGEKVAEVHFYFGDSGTVTVDAWDNKQMIHQGRATGGGYDKKTAAIAGATIAGIRIYEDAQECEESKQFYHEYCVAMAQARAQGESRTDVNLLYIKFGEHRGIQFTGYEARDAMYAGAVAVPGLDRLTCFGFKVHQAI